MKKSLKVHIINKAIYKLKYIIRSLWVKDLNTHVTVHVRVYMYGGKSRFSEASTFK